MHSLHRLNAIVRCGNLWRADKHRGLNIGACDRPYLFYICHHPGISQDALSSALFVNKSSVARRLLHLEHEGYVTRTPDEHDRRVLLVYPTEKARAILPAVAESSKSWNEIITKDFSPEEVALFTSLVNRAYENAKRAAKELTE